MTARPRRPAIFSPDDPNVIVTAAKDDPLVEILREADAPTRSFPPSPRPPHRGAGFRGARSCSARLAVWCRSGSALRSPS